ncbi:MAG: MarR family winged helix-turn-helix transcriptional regulator [Tagaea sp.]|nr:MarR family winged helix-turn-helix transcriptional regulator [Tagaea sp.]
MHDENLREIANTCACFHAREAARAVTRAYDRAFAPLGLRATQFSLLIALALAEPPTITDLAERLGMDRTTLTRNLRPLLRDGLVELAPADGPRPRPPAITRKGRALLAKARANWSQAQEGLARKLGRDGMDRALDALAALRAAA